MRRATGLLFFVSLFAVSGTTFASGVTETPDNGSEQMGRGGAWIARASDPLATLFNPAGLAGQPSRITIQANLLVDHTCFTRLRSASDTTADLSLVDGTGHYPRVCNDIQAVPNPQFAITWRVTDRLGLGFAVAGPSAPADKKFPEFITDNAGQPVAQPGRYLLLKQSGVIVFPTIGVGYEVIDNLRLGASVAWGIAKLKLATAVLSLNTDNSSPSTNDLRANLQAADYFVPQFSLGGLYSATPEIDIAGWYKWSDAIRSRGDVGTAANYFSKANAGGDDSGVRYGDTIYEDCGTGTTSKACGAGDNATAKFVIPMEAKLGIRYHKPRGVLTGWNGEKRAHLRDPLATDVFDIEADLTWANNSAVEAFEVRFPGDATGRGVLPVSGTGGEFPPNVDAPRAFKDTFGLRVGGDYNAIPDKLALRAGAFIESSALDERYQSIDFAPQTRFGIALGGTYRIRLGSDDKSSAIEIMAGYGHVFYADQTREDPKADGLRAIAGTSCNKSDPVSADKCADGNPRYRTKWPINLGTITNTLNVINVGLAYRF